MTSLRKTIMKNNILLIATYILGITLTTLVGAKAHNDFVWKVEKAETLPYSWTVQMAPVRQKCKEGLPFEGERVYANGFDGVWYLQDDCNWKQL